MVVDESGRSANQHGIGAKILCGEGALDLYLTKHDNKESMVHIVSILISLHSTASYSYLELKLAILPNCLLEFSVFQPGSEIST